MSAMYRHDPASHIPAEMSSQSRAATGTRTRPRSAPVASMAVFGDDGGRLDFPSRHGEPVAWIVEGNRIARAVANLLAPEESRVRRPRGVSTNAFGQLSAR